MKHIVLCIFSNANVFQQVHELNLMYSGGHI
jgi:hypothetical protein